MSVFSFLFLRRETSRDQPDATCSLLDDGFTMAKDGLDDGS